MTRAYWNEALETVAPGPLTDLTARLLREQLAYAGAHSAFYRAAWDGARVDPARVSGPDDLAALPFTEKHDLVAAQAGGGPFGTNQAAPADALVRMQATGGTTGRPLRMAMTRRDVETYNEVGARAAWAAGLRPGDILFECMNYSLYAGGISDHLTFETLGACVAPVGVGQSRRLLEILGDLGADALLYSTPSYARHLAEVAREQGVEPRSLRLRRGLFSGDAGLANRAYREDIEETFGLVARNIYGTGETAPVAAECDVADGLHFLGQGAFHPELIDPAADDPLPFTDGAEGELVLTTLTREAHPLIRFRTHDQIRVTTAPCACGRTGFRFRVLGRSDDMFIVRGINVFPLAVGDVVGEFRPDVTGEYQVVLLEAPPLVRPPVARVEASAGLPEAAWPGLAERVGARIRELLMFTADVEVVAAGALPRTELKARRLVRAERAEPGAPS